MLAGETSIVRMHTGTYMHEAHAVQLDALLQQVMLDFRLGDHRINPCCLTVHMTLLKAIKHHRFMCEGRRDL